MNAVLNSDLPKKTFDECLAKVDHDDFILKILLHQRYWSGLILDTYWVRHSHVVLFFEIFSL